MSDAPLPALLPDWTEFERDYLKPGVPSIYTIRKSPHVGLFTEAGGARLGAHFESEAEEAPTTPMNEIAVAVRVVGARRHIEISTSARGLYANFYGLVREVVSDVVIDERAPGAALTGAIARWQALLSRKSLMSAEAQAGLFGELWCLQRFAAHAPSHALSAWTGPTKQAHDFRFGDIELEVKATTGERRVHLINGIGQLEPSPGCTLHLVSLQLAAAGAGGRTLADMIAEIDGGLGANDQARAVFQTLLQAAGWNTDDAALHPARWRLRSAPQAVEVGAGVPRLTRRALAALDAEFAPTRLGRVVYEVDIEGLGAPFADTNLETAFAAAALE